MSLRVKVILVALTVAAASFPLTFVVWGPMRPTISTAAQMLRYGLVAAECLAMGGGVAFLIFGYPATRKRLLPPKLAAAAYVGIAFYLTNWWTHDHLHGVAATLGFASFIWMTIGLEYVFHVSMMIFAAVLAVFFVKVLLAEAAAVRAAAPMTADEAAAG